jgi:hypothetical protein
MIDDSPPPLKSTQTKHRQHRLRPLDEVFALGLGADEQETHMCGKTHHTS